MENYQFPPIADEPQAGSTMLQRLVLVDVTTGREVWMLYSSFLRAGARADLAHGPQAPAIAVATPAAAPIFPVRRRCRR